MEEQKITIRRLTPDLCEDWLHYFDEIAFKDHGDWGFCYCLEGHLDRDAAKEGYTYVETYPFADTKFEFQYHGTIGMYERNGFTEAADLKYVKIMQKRLN